MISSVNEVLLRHRLTDVDEKGVDVLSSAESVLKILPEFANGNCLKFVTRAFVEENSADVYCQNHLLACHSPPQWSFLSLSGSSFIVFLFQFTV